MSEQEDALFEKYGGEPREQLVTVIGQLETDNARLQKQNKDLEAMSETVHELHARLQAECDSARRERDRLAEEIDRLDRVVHDTGDDRGSVDAAIDEIERLQAIVDGYRNRFSRICGSCGGIISGDAYHACDKCGWNGDGELLETAYFRLQADLDRLDVVVHDAGDDRGGVDAAIDEIERLQAVVDTLDRTADGKVVTIGEQYYLICEHTGVRRGVVTGIRQKKSWVVADLTVWSAPTVIPGSPFLQGPVMRLPEYLYSTREAAQAKESE